MRKRMFASCRRSTIYKKCNHKLFVLVILFDPIRGSQCVIVVFGRRPTIPPKMLISDLNFFKKPSDQAQTATPFQANSQCVFEYPEELAIRISRYKSDLSSRKSRLIRHLVKRCCLLADTDPSVAITSTKASLGSLRPRSTKNARKVFVDWNFQAYSFSKLFTVPFIITNTNQQ